MAFFFRTRPPPDDPLRAISGSWSVENVTSLDAQTKLIQTVVHSAKRLKDLESQAPLEESVELFLRASGSLLAHMSGFLDAWAEEEDSACVVGLAPQMAWAVLEWRNFVVFCIREYHQGDSQRQIALLDDLLSSLLETLSRNPCRECIESLTRMKVGDASVLGRAARHVNAEVRSMCWGVLVALIEFEGTPRSNHPFPGLCRGPLAGDVDSLVSAETALMEGLVREAVGQGAVIRLGDDDLSQERARNLQSACRQRSTKLLALLLEDSSSPLFNLALMKSVVDSFLSESSCDPTEWAVIHSLTSAGQDYLVETEAFQLLMTVNLTAVSETVDAYRESFMDLFGSYVATTLPIFSSPPRSAGVPSGSLRLEMASAALVQFWRSRSLTRVVDGAIASGFLQELVEYVGSACLLQYPRDETLHSWIPQAVSNRFLFMLESSLFDSRVQQLLLKSSTWSRTFLSSNRNFVLHGRRLLTKILESHGDWVKTCLTATSEENVSVITDLLHTATVKKSYIHWSGGRTAHVTFAGALWPAWAATSLTGASIQGNASIVELLMCLRAYQSSSTTVFSQLLAGLTTLGFRLTDLVDRKPSDQDHLSSFKDLHNAALKGLSGLVGWQAADQAMLDCFLDCLKALGQLVAAAPTGDSLCTYLLALPLEAPTWVVARDAGQTTLLSLLLSYARLMHSLLSKKDGSSPQVVGAPEEAQSSLSWCLARVLIFLCMWEDRINGESAENGATDGFVDVVSSDPQQLLFFVELLKDLMRMEMIPWNGSDSNCPMLDSLVSALAAMLWVACSSHHKLFAVSAAGGHARLVTLIASVRALPLKPRASDSPEEQTLTAMLLGENGLLSVREAMELKALASRTEVVVLTFAANGGDQPSSVRTDSDQDPARVLISNQASELCELRSMLADLWKERPVEAEASKVKVSVLEEEVEVLRKENAEVTSALRESVEEVAALRHTLASQSVAHEKETRQLAVAYSQMEAAYDNEVFDATELLGRIQRVILTEGLIATDNEALKFAQFTPESPALAFTLVREDGRARTAIMDLPHGPVETPVFMPVGTQATIKGLLPETVAALGPQIILNNTYHLANRPGTDILEKAGGSHRFMGWNRNLLTDSGGFQMVSLLKLAEITEEGVRFAHPDTNEPMLLTPEESMRTQNVIGADVMMALDDVVPATEPTRTRVEEATHRTTRWIDRCIKAHANPGTQNLFGIVQGGLHPDLRRESLLALKQRPLPGFAIGGLSGGEAKDDFWRMVDICLGPEGLPANKPRYLMGVGHAADIVVCVALGVDMFDCVYPTRTARFGTALVDWHPGNLKLKQSQYKNDMQPIDPQCTCATCTQYSRAFLNRTATREPVAAQLITVHNLHYMNRLCVRMREEIRMGRFQQFAVDFLKRHFPAGQTPVWVRDALLAAGFDLDLLETVEWKLTLRVREWEGSTDVEPAPKRVK